MYGFLSISVGIDFDDNGKNKEKKQIMRHLKNAMFCFKSRNLTFKSYSVINCFDFCCLLREFRDEQNWRSFSVKIQIDDVKYFFQTESLTWIFMPKMRKCKDQMIFIFEFELLWLQMEIILSRKQSQQHKNYFLM